MDDERFLLSRRCAIASRPTESRVQAWADTFDDVQAIARETEAAGDFEEAPARSIVVGEFCWRGFLREALEWRPPGQPASYAPLRPFPRR